MKADRNHVIALGIHLAIEGDTALIERIDADLREEREVAGRHLPAGHVPMPQNADEAVAMLLLAENWLRTNAPDRLRAPSDQGQGAGR